MKIKKYLNIFVLMLIIVPVICYSVLAAPGSNNGTSSSASYKGATTLTSDGTIENKAYTSTTGSENALLVSGGTSTLNSCTITKSGDSSDENSDFYGTNAGILVYNGATLNIKGGTVTTSGGHANGVFAYGTGVINLTDTVINTTSNNSGGIMVTGGGTLTANNLTVKTKGNSSASIRSDRGGGTLTVNKGTYETNGVGSPAIYSTAKITVNDATLTSTASEGAIIEGANSITLNNVKLIDTNTTLNGNSETYKNIFIYQSMSGDASEGNATFTSTDSNFITNKGDSIFVTNTTATINLTNNTFTNKDGDFLRIQTGKWGNSGSNGGNVTLNMSNQKVTGNIIVDNISSLNMSLTSGSVLTGCIDNSNQASKVSLSLSNDSIFVLTGNSYVDTLSDTLTDNSNIYLNGYTLYVNGKAVTANNGTYNGTVTNTIDNDETTDTSNDTTDNELISTNEIKNISLYIMIISGIILVICVIMIKKSKK